MHLQRPKVLRRQGNRRGGNISRHIKPKLAQLSDALCDPSADRRQNQRIPVLCRWRMYQNIYSEERHLLRCRRTKTHPPTKLKDHLSYGGRVALRRYPFFMPVPHPVCCLASPFKIEKTSKLITNACLFFKNGGSGIPVERQARKDKHAETLLIQGFSVLWRGRSPSRRPDLEAASRWEIS